MNKQVWRVIKHGQTTGRDSGYPTIEPRGPLFSSYGAAKDECERLLLTLPEKDRICKVQLAGAGYSDPWTEVPVYEPNSYPILDRHAAAKRQQDFVTKEQQNNLAKIAQLKAQVAALRKSKP